MAIETVVRLKGVEKAFEGMPEPALREITATIEQGKITGIVGPDGAGKTTLMRLLAGLLLPTAGSINVLGKDTKNSELYEDVGYMPQRFGLYEDLTVLENLTLYAELNGLEGEEKEKAIEYMLDFTSLKPFVDRLTLYLSGGMKQKLGLASTLFSRPRLLLLDEPSVGVDPLSRRELWKIVKGLVKTGLTVVWATSTLEEVAHCEKVLLLNEGKLLFSGDPQILTKKMKGRVFTFQVPFKERRTLLSTLLKKPAINDGTLQGNDIRCVVAPSFKKKEEGWKEASPRFEDAFLDILGPHKEKGVTLADVFPSKKKITWPLIKADNIVKRFGDFTAVRDVSFSIKQGEVFGLLGPNGAGKSTVFKMLCGLLKPNAGKIFVSGYDLLINPSKAAAHIGYMAQKFSLYDNLSVQENLTFFAGIYGLEGKGLKEKINMMIDLFELSPFLSVNAGVLSLGYKQRLALACAVMHDPDIVFLDEPTSGVDPITRREFWTHINGMVNKGVAVMITTHFLEEAEYCDKIALIYGGSNIASGTPMEIRKKAATKKQPTPTLEDAFITLVKQSQLS